MINDYLSTLDSIEQALKERDEIQILAIGRSMLPLISPGQLVSIKRCEPHEVKKGDIVLVKKEGCFIFHRVHRIEKKGRERSSWLFLTRGDTSDQFDSPAPPDSVVAKASLNGGNAFTRYWRVILNQWFGFYIILITRCQGRFLKILSPVFRRKLEKKIWFPDFYRLKTKLFGQKPISLLSEKIWRTLFQRLKIVVRLQEFIQIKRRLYRFHILSPQSHIIQINPKDSLGQMLTLWNRSIKEPKFETTEDIRDALFFCLDPQSIICLACVQKDKFLGVIIGYRTSLNIGSIEVIGVDPEFRRRGVGTFLLTALKKRFLANKIRSLYISGSGRFFPGLQLEDHEAAIRFFIKHGFSRPRFTEEAILRHDFYKEPKGLHRVMNLCQKNGLIFESLDLQRRDSFLRFIDEESPESSSWVRQRLMSLGSDSTKEDFWIARLGDDVIGCFYYANAVCLKDFSTRFREAEWKKSGMFDGSELYIWKLLVIAKSHRGRGIGGVLLHQAFSQVWKLNPFAAFVLNHNLPKFYGRFHFKKMDRFMSLYCP